MLDARAGLDYAAVADESLLQLRPQQARGRQESHARIDHAVSAMKIEWRGVLGQSQVCFVEGPHRAEVFPVAVEQMSGDAMRAQAAWKNLLAEVGSERRRIKH